MGTFSVNVLMAAAAAALSLPIPSDPSAGILPDAIVDLATAEGVAAVQGAWEFCDASIVEVANRDPGPDLRASGPPNRTHDVAPRAGTAEFESAAWSALAPDTLERRRTTGRLAFGWYRFAFRVPERVGEFDPTGATLVFEIVVDDYAEVWINGALPQVLGQSGGPVIAGWNAPNRIVVERSAQPGQTFELAVFAANGPLSQPPDNFVWVRSATLDFYAPGRIRAFPTAALTVERLDPRLDALLGPEPTLEEIAAGFTFTEGPVWSGNGYLLFSDPNRNLIYRWAPDGEVSTFRTKSGYKGIDIGQYRQPGSNGLTFDAQGRLTICEHGNRRVTRLENNGVLTVLADRYQGKRLNSPNDLVYRSDGALYFTDPPFGLPGSHEDPRRELPFSGVYCYSQGELKLISTDLSGPNGLAFSPDERFLYVCNWDEQRKVLMRYAVSADGGLSDGQVFCDMGDAAEEGALDGVKVDRAGNLYVCGPGGIWIIAPDGARLGRLRMPIAPHNLAWAESGRTLYVTAESILYRLRINNCMGDGRSGSAARCMHALTCKAGAQ